MPNLLRTAVVLVVLAAVPALAQPEKLTLSVDETRALAVEGVLRVAIEDPAIADVRVGEQGILELTGRVPGKTTMVVWSGKGAEHRRTTVVQVEAGKEPAAPVRPAPAAQPSTASVDETLALARGESRVLEFAGIQRLAVGDPAVADVVSRGNQEFEVKGMAAGTTTLLVWREGQPRYSVRVVVK